MLEQFFKINSKINVKLYYKTKYFFIMLMFHKIVYVYKRKYQTPNINNKVMFYNKSKEHVIVFKLYTYSDQRFIE